MVGVATVGELGEVLVGANGLTLYAFTKDVDGASTCLDACAAAWPALTVTEGFAVAAGLDGAVFTTVERPDGTKQLKVGKWPLYYYAGDGAPGETNGQGVGEVWFAVAADRHAGEAGRDGAGHRLVGPSRIGRRCVRSRGNLGAGLLRLLRSRHRPVPSWSSRRSGTSAR